MGASSQSNNLFGGGPASNAPANPSNNSNQFGGIVNGGFGVSNSMSIPNQGGGGGGFGGFGANLGQPNHAPASSAGSYQVMGANVSLFGNGPALRSSQQLPSTKPFFPNNKP